MMREHVDASKKEGRRARTSTSRSPDRP